MLLHEEQLHKLNTVRVEDYLNEKFGKENYVINLDHFDQMVSSSWFFVSVNNEPEYSIVVTKDGKIC